MKKFLLNFAVALDIFALSIFAIIPLLLSYVGINIPTPKERQTISGYLGSDFDGSIFERIVNFIFYKNGWWKDTDHCSDVDKEEEQIFKIENQ